MKVEAHKYQGGVQYWFFCPGCKNHHAFTVKDDGTGWSFNGDVNNPTFKPSLLCSKGHAASRCHSFVREGRIQFLPDCHHELRGQTVEMEVFDSLFNTDSKEAS